MAVQNIVEVIGGDKLSALLGQMSERAANMTEVFQGEIRYMEEFEQSLFAGYGGRYVKTGKLRASLTEPGADAVRDVNPKGMVFGTHVFYARFQTEHIGPQTARGGLARSGANMVVQQPPDLGERVTAKLGDHIMGTE
ncbi:MAG TPA: hypothetical protein VGG82_07655 [Casimicrobiaceae bacterium]|jgi:hypothetical protein